MLDGTPVLRSKSTASGGSRSPRFREHFSELEDTSSYPAPHTPPVPVHKRLSRLSTATHDSPTLGKTASGEGPAEPTPEGGKPRQHLMSWNNYDETHAIEADEIGDNSQDAITATMTTPKSMPKARSPEDKHQVSPDLSGSPLDRNFIVSPMGSVVGKNGRS